MRKLGFTPAEWSKLEQAERVEYLADAYADVVESGEVLDTTCDHDAFGSLSPLDEVADEATIQASLLLACGRFLSDDDRPATGRSEPTGDENGTPTVSATRNAISCRDFRETAQLSYDDRQDCLASWFDLRKLRKALQRDWATDYRTMSRVR